MNMSQTCDPPAVLPKSSATVKHVSENSSIHEGDKEHIDDSAVECHNIDEKAGPSAGTEAKLHRASEEQAVTIETANEVFAMPSEVAIKVKLLSYLEEDTFTMNVTERQIRGRLEEHFGVPLKDKKKVIRDEASSFACAGFPGSCPATLDQAHLSVTYSVASRVPYHLP